MDCNDDEDYGFGPALVSLTPFTASVPPSPRRLSSCFTQPSKPVRAKRQLAWVSLQGRLVGAEDATSARTIGNGVLTPKEAVAWEMFTPIQRVLIVAVASVAAVDSNKNKQIFKLQKSVQLRDQVLLSMQQKLDNLCEQVNYFKDQPEVVAFGNVSVAEGDECGCKQRKNVPQNESLVVNASTKGLNEDEVFKYKKPPSNEVEPEERRMSDLSNWAPSVASSVDVQLENLAMENGINSLRKECQEKEVTISQLSTYLQTSEVLGSKRIAELEDIIRRKNMIINKLRKDIITLEQKVVNLTRLRRSSFPAPRSSNVQQHYVPVMADNVLYDMDSTTGPSSSESDGSPKSRAQAPARRAISYQISGQNASKGEFNSPASADMNQNPHTSTPLKEKSLNHHHQKSNSVPVSKPKSMVSGSGENRARRRAPVKSKEVAPQKRWA